MAVIGKMHAVVSTYKLLLNHQTICVFSSFFLIFFKKLSWHRYLKVLIHVTQLCSSCLCNKGTTTNSHQQRVCKQVKMFCLHMEQPHITSTVTTRKANSDILDNIKITLIGLKCRSIKKGRTSKLESQHNDSIERKTLQIKIKSSKNFKKFIILL